MFFGAAFFVFRAWAEKCARKLHNILLILCHKLTRSVLDLKEIVIFVLTVGTQG